jgi:chromosome segregation ATPase
MTTRKYLLWAVLATIVLAGPIGCGKKEIDELKIQVASLEKELADTKAKLADADKETQEVRSKGEQGQANVEAQTAELVKVKVERDRLKQELAALKKRR